MGRERRSEWSNMLNRWPTKQPFEACVLLQEVMRRAMDRAIDPKTERDKVLENTRVVATLMGFFLGISSGLTLWSLEKSAEDGKNMAQRVEQIMAESGTGVDFDMEVDLFIEAVLKDMKSEMLKMGMVMPPRSAD